MCVPFSHSCVYVESVVVVDLKGVTAAAPPARLLEVAVHLTSGFAVFFN